MSSQPINTDRHTKWQQTIEYRKSFPEMTLREIGDAVGYTRERIRQILSEENLATRSSGRKFSKPKDPCLTCDQPVPRRRMLYCSPQCRHPQGKTTFSCTQCNQPVTVMTSVYKSRTSKSSNIYCNRTCRDLGHKRLI
jgi:hypothetical protein